MKESEVRSRARQFAIDVIEICKGLDTRGGNGVLINQLVRSATSIGANIHEANYAASRADFANKLQIALKECYETEYWVDLMEAVGCITEDYKSQLLQESGVIRRMLVKSINTVKEG
ncbi:MAG: four helix bundle protein [Clostridia bacterium]|nr:four helix bundle protein [Clostridia bacterium]